MLLEQWAAVCTKDNQIFRRKWRGWKSFELPTFWWAGDVRDILSSEDVWLGPTLFEQGGQRGGGAVLWFIKRATWREWRCGWGPGGETVEERRRQSESGWPSAFPSSLHCLHNKSLLQHSHISPIPPPSAFPSVCVCCIHSKDKNSRGTDT